MALLIHDLEQGFDNLVRPISVQVLLKVWGDVDSCLLTFVHLDGLVNTPQGDLEASPLLLGRVPLVLNMREWDHVRLELNVSLLNLGYRGSHSDMGISKLWF